MEQLAEKNANVQGACLIKRLLRAAQKHCVGASVEAVTVGTMVLEGMKTVAAIKLQPTIGHAARIQLLVMATSELSEVRYVVISHVLCKMPLLEAVKVQTSCS